MADLDLVAPLFDAYRRFYRQEADLQGAKRFLLERFAHNQSVIFIALDAANAIGFTQLYPSFTSTEMARIFVLNDLFVAPEARGRGVGAALLGTAADYGRRIGARRLELATETTNATAQAVYERMGWVQNTEFMHYSLAL